LAKTRGAGGGGRRAIYAGSFDPITNGHLDVIRRGAALFGDLVVAVGNNPAKRYLLDLQERLALVTDVVSGEGVGPHDRPRVRVVAFEGLLVHAAEREGATVILRGLRSAADFDSEFRYGLANRHLSGIETVFVLSEPANLFVSSSLVKEIASGGGDVAAYVPEQVLPLLRERLSPRKTPSQ
jgi:pantetheine-phosphate adenylyltransferase